MGHPIMRARGHSVRRTHRAHGVRAGGRRVVGRPTAVRRVHGAITRVDGARGDRPGVRSGVRHVRWGPGGARTGARHRGSRNNGGASTGARAASAAGIGATSETVHRAGARKRRSRDGCKRTRLDRGGRQRGRRRRARRNTTATCSARSPSCRCRCRCHGRGRGGPPYLGSGRDRNAADRACAAEIPVVGHSHRHRAGDHLGRRRRRAGGGRHLIDLATRRGGEAEDWHQRRQRHVRGGRKGDPKGRREAQARHRG
ncbi:hypothetical protein BU14_0383s0011 [Porphyra umbilicalis]|uniref:Uncharacterized protein n=1 Tax=Porphyra umbilicalis TaxID=2786 RepID=A0A1X6NWS1_PORUM|nr:hypothetical protein BU14_0383s0011 [Porphyra umbilicalis]|eukprot:OSX73037.1 hypothetical protein BU14_0383s0011 [Porphyra umbilicalis]